MFARALTRSIARRPKRFAVAVIAVAMGVGMAVAFGSISLVLGDRLGHTARQYGANLVLVPRGADLPLEVGGADLSAMVETGAIPDSTLTALTTFRWRNSVLAYAPQLREKLVVGGAPTTVIGTWFDRTPDWPANPARSRPALGMKALAPWWRVEGRMPDERVGAPAEALVGRALARRLGVHVGAGATVAVAGATLPVAGIVDAGGLEDDQMYVPLAWLAAQAGRAGQVDRVLVSALALPGEAPPMPDPARDIAAYEKWTCRPFAGSIARELERSTPGASVRPVVSLERGEGRLVGRLNLLMLLLTGAALTAAILGVMSTMVASVVDRTQEIALLRALGATAPAVGRLFLAEALVVAAVGGALGVAIGFALAQGIGQRAFGTAVEPHPMLLPAGFALAAFVCLAGAWLPLARATAIDPARALKAGA
jgi:putative ABC transport system permease protein